MQEFHTPADYEIAPGETCLTAMLDTARRYPHGATAARRILGRIATAPPRTIARRRFSFR